MNKADRKELQKVIDLIEEARIIISAVRDGEQEKYDNLPEGIQDSERGEKLSNNVDELESIESNLEDMIPDIENVIHN